jgi:hypothetical protein
LENPHQHRAIRIVAADPQSGQVVYLGLITENGWPNTLGVRLRVTQGRIAEIETFVSRGNPLFDVASLTSPRVALRTAIPPELRPMGCAEGSRQGASQIDSVDPRRFVVFDEERGLAVGVFSLNLSAARTKLTRPDGSTRPVAEWAMYPATGPVLEMFKISGGKIHEIEVVMMPLLPYRIGTGW